MKFEKEINEILEESDFKKFVLENGELGFSNHFKDVFDYLNYCHNIYFPQADSATVLQFPNKLPLKSIDKKAA